METYKKFLDARLPGFLALIYTSRDHSLGSYATAVRSGVTGNYRRFGTRVKPSRKLPMASAASKSGIFVASKFGARFPLSPYVDHLPAHLLEPISLGKGSLTWSNCRTGWNHYLDSCERYGFTPEFPVPLYQILGFITYLHRIRNLAPSTVTSYMAAVKLWQAMKGFPPSDWSDPVILLILKGYRNLALTQLKTPQVKSVITWPVLRLLRAEIWKLNMSELDRQCYWTASVLAFWGSLRMGELLEGKLGFDKIRCMSWSKLVIEGDFHILVYVELPKIIDDERPSDHVDLFEFPIDDYCPIYNVRRLDHLNAIRNPDYLDLDSSVFLLSNNHPITMDMMNQLLKRTLDPLFPGLGRFTPHSFRSGLPSLMGAFPALFTEAQLKQKGRWLSDACNRYQKTNGDGLRRTHDALVKALLEDR